MSRERSCTVVRAHSTWAARARAVAAATVATSQIGTVAWISPLDGSNASNVGSDAPSSVVSMYHERRSAIVWWRSAFMPRRLLGHRAERRRQRGGSQ